MPSDRLDSLGRTILAYADYRVFGLVGVGIIIIALIFHRRTKGVWPERDDVVRAAIGVLMLNTAITVFCVFFLTKPPLLEALSSEGFSVTAFIAFIFMCGLGISEIKRLF